jgi:hypothetical protein
MNCSDFSDAVAAYTEGQLDARTRAAFEQHLATCMPCREYHADFLALREELTARASASSGINLAAPVMARIQTAPVAVRHPLAALHSLPRWWIGIGAAAAVALGTFLLVAPTRTSAMADGAMQRGIQAASGLRTVHLTGRIRAPAAENFSRLDPKSDFVSIDLWKEFDGARRWRVEKPGVVAVMDGTSTAFFNRAANSARRIERPSSSAFDTQWLHDAADIERALTAALAMARTKGWQMDLARETDAVGTTHVLVTIDAHSGAPAGDYTANKFFQGSDLRYVYRFDDATGRLEALRVYSRAAPNLPLMFEVTQIDYNQAFDPATFALEIPADANWYREPETIANNGKYAAMTADEAARGFFEACARRDWPEVEVYRTNRADDRFQRYLGGIVIVEIGHAFTSALYPGEFVPYVIQFADGTQKRHNLALKRHPRTGRWYVDGGI